jgi:GTPase
MAASAGTRCGTVAIVGRPNVGKSTLLNALVGQKISITSRKAQTTRHRILGVRTRGAAQFVFVDTPGFQTRHGQALNRNLNRAVRSSLADVDLVLLLVEAGRFGADDARVVELLPADVPTILVANKLDAVHRRADLLPWLQGLPEHHDFAEYVPMSAERGADVERLLDIIEPRLPQQPWRHDPDELTDRNERFLAGEIVREKLFRLTGDELPYTSTVVVDRFEEEPAEAAATAARRRDQSPLRRRVQIAATIVVEREPHKGIVIGRGGERLKRIGSEARHELEHLLDAQVMLALWVQVRSGWADDEHHLRSYGLE